MSIACPVCSGAVSPNAPRCDECLVLLEWAGGPRAKHPFIRPGDPLLFFDLTRMPLPGQVAMARTFSDGSRFEPAPSGSLLHVAPKRAIEAYEEKLRARDGCVRAAFMALDPYLSFSCVARIERFGEVEMKYSLQIDCETRQVRLTRGFSGQKEAAYQPLVPYTSSPAVGPVGAMNVLELRCQGATLEARVNDQHVGTVHDPVLGIGAFGLRAESMVKANAPQRMVVAWFEVRQVIA